MLRIQCQPGRCAARLAFRPLRSLNDSGLAPVNEASASLQPLPDGPLQIAAQRPLRLRLQDLQSPLTRAGWLRGVGAGGHFGLALHQVTHHVALADHGYTLGGSVLPGMSGGVSFGGNFPGIRNQGPCLGTPSRNPGVRVHQNDVGIDSGTRLPHPNRRRPLALAPRAQLLAAPGLPVLRVLSELPRCCRECDSPAAVRAVSILLDLIRH